jgi:hypothetical protein
MEIRVTLANGNTATFKGGYQLTQSGILSVTDDEGRTVKFSPTGWLCIEHLSDTPTMSVYEDRGVEPV